MGVTNVYNQSKINTIKLNLGNQAKKATAAKPDYMQMTGSIFSAPGVKNQAPASLNDLNTQKSLSDIKSSNQPSPSQGNGNTVNSSAEGEAAQKAAEDQADNLKSLTNDSKGEKKIVDDFNKDAQKLEKDLKKDDKKFQSTLQKQQAELKKDNLKLQKLVNETNEAQKQINDAQSELESLLGSSGFSINGTEDSNNQAKIKELQTFIGGKTALVQSNGKSIYSLQKSSSKTLAKMNKTNASYVKTQKTNAKQIEQNETKADKVIKFATKMEQISTLVQQGGETINMLGQGLVIAGQAMSSNPYTAAIGAGMISTGSVMQKVGEVVKMVGNYGATAANITKTAAYAATGNLQGAMTSAAAAIQTGAAAVKSTTGLKQSFGKIDAAADQATQKLAANTAANDAVKDMTQEELGGMTKKEMKKSISSNLQNEMSQGKVDAKGLLKDIKGGELSQSNFESVTNAIDKGKTSFADTVGKSGFSMDGNKILDGNGKEITKKQRKQIGSAFTNKGTGTQKASKKFDFGKLASIPTAVSSCLGSTNTSQTQKTKKKNIASQMDLANDARYQRIKQKNLAYAQRGYRA